MPPPMTPRCHGRKCGLPPGHPQASPVRPWAGAFGRRPGVFGNPLGVFGVPGNRPGSPFLRPPIAPPVRPGAPVIPPPINQPGVASPGAAHPPAPPPIAPPLIAAPPAVPIGAGPWPSPPYPTGGYVADQRTHAPTMPPFDASYDPSGEVAWSYADDGALYVDPSQIDPVQLEAGGPAWDLWQGLFASYLDTRNAATSASGEVFPQTTAGDVRKASLQLSRELCLPRYDFADLAATRAAWRDALARVHALCASAPWSAPYPENERFWLNDSLALAQRLAAVDTRRNAMVARGDGVLTLVADSDPLTTWTDLRAYFIARRMVRLDERSWRYPETTLGDVRQVVRLLNQHVADILDRLPAAAYEHGWLLGHVRRWRPIADAVKAGARQAGAEDTYPDNAAFWRESRRIAIALSTVHDLLRTPGYLELVARRAGIAS